LVYFGHVLVDLLLLDADLLLHFLNRVRVLTSSELLEALDFLPDHGQVNLR
jgi:hypothetical protein